MIIFYNCINTRRKVISTNIGHQPMVPLWEGNWQGVLVRRKPVIDLTRLKKKCVYVCLFRKWVLKPKFSSIKQVKLKHDTCFVNNFMCTSYIHTYTHTHIHTYIYIYIYIYSVIFLCVYMYKNILIKTSNGVV